MKNEEHLKILQLYQAAQQGTATLLDRLPSILRVSLRGASMPDAATSQRRAFAMPGPALAVPPAANDPIQSPAPALQYSADCRLHVRVDDGRVACEFDLLPSASTADRAACSRLEPHLAQACSLAQQIDAKRQRVWWSQTLLNDLAMPVWLLNAQGHTVIINRAAKHWLQQSELVSSQAHDQRYREQAWQRFLFDPLQDLLNGDRHRITIAASAFARPGAGAGKVWCELRQLPPVMHLEADSAALAGSLSQALLLVRLLRWEASAAQLRILQTRWSLTETEREIVALLLQDYCLKQIATLRQRAESTVRRQVKTLLRKCRFASQEALIAAFCDELAMMVAGE